MTGTDELLQERFALAYERVKEIRFETAAPEPYRVFFSKEACFLTRIFEKYEELCDKNETGKNLEEAEQFYEELLPGAYENSFGDPACAVSVMGTGYGRLLCWLYVEIIFAAVFAFDKRPEDLTAAAELFLEIYSGFTYEEMITAEQLRGIIYSYNHDYCADFTEQYIDELAGRCERSAVPQALPSRSIDLCMPLAGKYRDGGKYAACLRDHKYDCGLYLDERLVTARLQALQNTLKKDRYSACKDKFRDILRKNGHGDAAEEAGPGLDKKSRKLLEKYITASCKIIERYINIGEG